MKMLPSLSAFKSESGLKMVIDAYHKYLPQFDVILVDENAKDYDVLAVHAGITNDELGQRPFVAQTHGLYWTADYNASSAEYDTNAQVIATCVGANAVTVPSDWVAEVFKRDMRISPYVIHHGIEYKEWLYNNEHQGYVLWNKNRNVDVCDPTPVNVLAEAFPDIQFVTTFAKEPHPANVVKIGLQPHDKMKKIVQASMVYLSTTKETFGIGTLEAMASGVPVLGISLGGNLDIVKHGDTGYLVRPGDVEGLIEGLGYCIKHRDIMSENSKIQAESWGWEEPVSLLAKIFKEVAGGDARPIRIPESMYIRQTAERELKNGS
jgi:hypothetical protein